MNTFNENQEQPDENIIPPIGVVESQLARLFGDPDDMPYIESEQYIQRQHLSGYHAPGVGKSIPNFLNPLLRFEDLTLEDVHSLIPGSEVEGLVLTGEVIGAGGSTSDRKLMERIHRIIEGTYEGEPDAKEIPNDLRPLLTLKAMDAEISNLTQETESKPVD